MLVFLATTQQSSGGAAAMSAVDVIDQILCHCQSIQQGIAIILKSFVPTAHVSDFSPSQCSFSWAFIECTD